MFLSTPAFRAIVFAFPSWAKAVALKVFSSVMAKPSTLWLPWVILSLVGRQY
jgi:hypothetical protein